MIGVPTVGEHSFLFSQNLLGAIMPSNFSSHIRFCYGLEVGRARNLLIHEAKKIGAKYLLFRDEDVIAPANVITKLLYNLQNHPDWTMIGGVYTTKQVPPEPLIYMEWGQGCYWGWKQGDIVGPVKFSGMGCNMIRMSDLELLHPKKYYDRDVWNGEDIVVEEYFKTVSNYELDNSLVNKMGGTEDAYFYSLMEAAGLKAFIDTGIACSHFDKDKKTFYVLPIDNGIAVKPEAWNHNPRIVNLGAGGQYNPYEVQVDLREGETIDYHCDIRSLPLDWDETFDIVKSNHVLEHFSFTDTQNILIEWKRILKPGGIMIIRVPNLEYAAKQILAGNMSVEIFGNVWGDQGNNYWMQGPYGGEHDGKFIPHSYENNYHKSGFTLDYLKKCLEDIGLNIMKAIDIGREIVIYSRKEGDPIEIDPYYLDS